jgi:hypothetical protein
METGSVLHVDSSQCTLVEQTTSIKHQASSIKRQASSVKHQASSIKHQASSTKSSIKHQASSSKYQHQASSIKLHSHISFNPFNLHAHTLDKSNDHKPFQNSTIGVAHTLAFSQQVVLDHHPPPHACQNPNPNQNVGEGIFTSYDAYTYKQRVSVVKTCG